MKGVAPQTTWNSLNLIRWLPVVFATVLSVTLAASLSICVIQGKSQTLDKLPFIAPYFFQFGMNLASIVGCASIGLVYCIVKQHRFTALVSLGSGLGSMVSLYLYTMTPSESQFPSYFVNTQSVVALACYFGLSVGYGIVTAYALRKHEQRRDMKKVSHMTSLRYTLLALMTGSTFVYGLAFIKSSYLTQMLQNYFGLMAFFISAAHLATFTKELSDMKLGWSVNGDEESRALLQSTFS
mmetsp:Transcript_27610/g.49810  ORF Transcript_27610/g.49810 Transcript_27610/m.49810 type:complete len:239 (-) Transcript_27610:3939-4655(-)